MNAASSHSTWTLFVPRQFSLRALLLFITIAAGFTWWYVRRNEGTITQAQASKVKMQMSVQEVEALLGKPRGFVMVLGEPMHGYKVITTNPDDDTLLIGFSEGRVIWIQQQSSSGWQSYPPLLK